MIHKTCTKLQNPTCNSPEKYLSQISLCITLEWEIRQNKSEFCFLSHNILGHSQWVYKIWRLALIEAENFVTENLLGEKEKWTNKGNDKLQHAESLLHNTRSHNQHLYQIQRGMISSSMLTLFYTIQQVIPNICTKFQNPRHSSSWEIFDTNIPIYYGKMEKNAKINHRILVFFPTLYLAPLKRYTKFEDSGCNRSGEFCDEKFYWRERKMDK